MTVANLSKWLQPQQPWTAAAGTAGATAKPKLSGFLGGDGNAFLGGQADPKLGAMSSLLQQESPGDVALQGPEAMDGPGGSFVRSLGLDRMGPNVNPSVMQLAADGVTPTPTVGSTAGRTWEGPLGAVPSHRGWAGLKDNAKEWTLRMLGVFAPRGAYFASGYRSPQENARVNGHPNSGHMRGDKVDIGARGNVKFLREMEAWAKRYGARTLVHNAGSGIHLDISWHGVPTSRW